MVDTALLTLIALGIVGAILFSVLAFLIYQRVTVSGARTVFHVDGGVMLMMSDGSLVMRARSVPHFFWFLAQTELTLTASVLLLVYARAIEDALVVLLAGGLVVLWLWRIWRLRASRWHIDARTRLVSTRAGMLKPARAAWIHIQTSRTRPALRRIEISVQDHDDSAVILAYITDAAANAIARGDQVAGVIAAALGVDPQRSTH
jgi:hypothetical protein